MTVTTNGPTTEAPGPKGRFLFGTLSRFRKDPLRLLAELRDQYGGVVQVQWGPYRLHEVTDPDAVRRVLQGNARNYVRGRLYRGFRLFFGTGMLTTDGAEWRKGRQISQPFFQRTRLRAVSPVITERTDAMLARWDEPIGSGRPVDLGQEMMRLAIDVLGRMVLGTDLDRHVDELLPAVRFAAKAVVVNGEFGQMLPGWVPSGYRRRLRRAQRTLDRVMDQVIDEQRRRDPGSGEPENLVAALLAARDENGDAALGHERIRDELKTVFLAGHETTGCALTWTLYAVAQHPAVRRTLEDELDRVLGDRAPTAADLPQLPYLGQIVAESLRLYPPIWAFPRDTTGDDVLGGHHVRAGSSILIPLHTIHTDPKHWENPGAFDPERFCPARGDLARPAYLPFGLGSRKCIGYEMALLELQLATGAIAQRFRLEPLPARWVRPLPLVSLRPRPRIMVRISARPRRSEES